MNIKKKLITCFMLAALFFSLGFMVHKTYEYKTILNSLMTNINTENIQSVARLPVSTRPILEKVVSKVNPWRTVQESVKDTVLQVFSQVTEFDIKQPYKTPRQYAAYGSGFFINEDGDLITNAHVVNEARAIWIQIPSLGKRIIDVEVIGVAPEVDLALLRVSEQGLELIKDELGKVSHLNFGNSDLVHRADEVMALGYPLGQQSLKSTTGVISGREGNMIQMSAPINPGSSGGPLLNLNGEVVGINTAGISAAQSVGYIIPINDLKIILPDLYKVRLLRKPFLGILSNNATENLTEFLGNPQPGGCYVVEIIKNSTLDKAGIKRGDMIYEINGHKLDLYGDMAVSWSEDKVSIMNYVSRLSVGQDVNLVVYRNGQRMEMNAKFSQASLPAIRKIYPGFEEIDYEVFGGMVVMQLTLNHVQELSKIAPGLIRFAEMKNQSTPVLVVTHIFPTSQLYRTRTLMIGSTLNQINGIEVKTLDDFRKAIKQVKNNQFTILASDQVLRASDNVFIVLPFDKMLQEEAMLSCDYKYPVSTTSEQLLAKFTCKKSEKSVKQIT